ncbi:serine/threonine/tyrosine protein kinase [Martiniozyma asiatica (nom. inval.)]|nr:serine/threonine/tyrosine protein kinase [Martiniozyma asiatica]
MEDTDPTQPTQPSNYNPSTDLLRQELKKEGVVCRLVGTTIHESFTIDIKLKDSKFDENSGKREWFLGRNQKNNTYKLPIESTRISNRHFTLWTTQEINKLNKLMIVDLSTNGTFLNNSKLEKGKNYLLTQGDEISVGNGVSNDTLRMVVHLPMLEVNLKNQDGIHKHFIISDEIIGSGAFATVRKAVERETGITYAAKIISKKKAFTSGMDGVTRELRILKNLDHPGIVRLKSFYEDETEYYIVMEYVSGGDLMDFVAGYGIIEEEPAREIARQIVDAIKHVHSKGISHRDLKPDNILIAQDNPVIVKITDFGLAKGKENESQMKTFCGTLAYLAPEVLNNKKSRVKKRYLGNGKIKADSYSNKVDMWSIGCLLFVIMTGHLPFGGSTQDVMFKNITEGNYHDELLKKVQISSEGRDFIARLIEPDVDLRMDAEISLLHPWLRNINSDVCLSQSQSGSQLQVKSQSQKKNQGSPSSQALYLDQPFESKKRFKVPEVPRERFALPFSQDNKRDDNNKNGNDDDNENDKSKKIISTGTLLKLKLVSALPNTDTKYPQLINVPQGKNSFFIGRVRCNDVEINDERISKVHCLINKRRHPMNGANNTVISPNESKELVTEDISQIEDQKTLQLESEYQPQTPVKQQHSFTLNSPAQALDDIWFINNGTNPCFINNKRMTKEFKVKIKQNDIISLFVDNRSNERLDYEVDIVDLTGLWTHGISTEPVQCDNYDLQNLKPMIQLANGVLQTRRKRKVRIP